MNLFAHKLNLFLDYEEDKLYIYSYFNSGAPCKNCKIELFDSKQILLKTLETDEKGEYFLKDYEKVSYVKVEALGGHLAKEKINDALKNDKEKKAEIKSESSILSSIIAIGLIILIFLGLKRVKK
ncbi:hypothetical protein [Arcobacter sp. CECT 8983]|uniref:hypothetical protein n=1 Tax=Arcobacter sp. CECT 8983 TaxID=2044508 RepID=UPI00100A9A2A|nr:hypothetical protein [Arcobacter sp. CECT 8983]